MNVLDTLSKIERLAEECCIEGNFERLNDLKDYIGGNLYSLMKPSDESGTWIRENIPFEKDNWLSSSRIDSYKIERISRRNETSESIIERLEWIYKHFTDRIMEGTISIYESTNKLCIKPEVVDWLIAKHPEILRDNQRKRYLGFIPKTY